MTTMIRDMTRFMQMPNLSLTALFVVSIMHSAWAADFSDPEWPCVQRKVENISIGQMWPHPLENQPIDESMRINANSLSSLLTHRRYTAEEAEELVQEFVASTENPVDLNVLGVIYSNFFEQIRERRRQIMAGIARYATKQTALSKQIDSARSEMRKLQSSESPDFDRMDELEAQLDWDQRIYEERAKSLIYVCEVPVLLEKHAYSIAQLLLRHAEQ